MRYSALTRPFSISGSHRLSKRKGLLHHDISIYNLAYYRGVGDKLVGILLDFELAMVGYERTPLPPGRVGTKPFMAHEYMFYPDHPYELRHDLESYLYCAIWHGLGYDLGVDLPHETGAPEDILYDWREGSWDSMILAKRSFIMQQSEGIIALMPDAEFAEKCSKLREPFTTHALRTNYEANIEDMNIPPSKRQKFKDGKLTYKLLANALGVEVDCDGPCCLQDE